MAAFVMTALPPSPVLSKDHGPHPSVPIGVSIRFRSLHCHHRADTVLADLSIGVCCCYSPVAYGVTLVTAWTLVGGRDLHTLFVHNASNRRGHLVGGSPYPLLLACCGGEHGLQFLNDTRCSYR